MCICIYTFVYEYKYTYGQESPGWISLFKLVTFLCWKYTETLICLVKLIGLWIPNNKGRGNARDIKKIIFIFKSRQKMVTKLGQFSKLSKLCYHFFFEFWKLKFFFFYIPSYPRPSPSGIHWSINFGKKKWAFLYIF